MSCSFLRDNRDSVREILRFCPSCPNNLFSRAKPNKPPPSPAPRRKKLKKQKLRTHHKSCIPTKTVSCPQRLEQIAQPTIRQIENNLVAFSSRWEPERFAKQLKLFQNITIPYLNQHRFRARRAHTEPNLIQHSPHRKPVKKKASKKIKPLARKIKEEQEWLEAQTAKMANAIVHYISDNKHINIRYKHMKLGLKLYKLLEFGKKKCLSQDVKCKLERYCIMLANIIDTVCRPYRHGMPEVETIQEVTTEEKKQCKFDWDTFENLYPDIEEIEEETEEFREEVEVSWYELQQEETPITTVMSEPSFSQEILQVQIKPKTTHKRTHYIHTFRISEVDSAEGEEDDDEIIDVYEEVPLPAIETVKPVASHEPVVKEIVRRIFESGMEKHYYVEEYTIEEYVQDEEEETFVDDVNYDEPMKQKSILRMQSHQSLKTTSVIKVRKVEISAIGEITESYQDQISPIDERSILSENKSFFKIGSSVIALTTQRIGTVREELEPALTETEEQVSFNEEPEVPEEAHWFDDDDDLVCNTCMPLPKLFDGHHEGSVSYVAVCLYMSWLTEFGRNMTIYMDCLSKFRSFLTGSSTGHYADTIEGVLKNWGEYLRDSRFADKIMTDYFKNKPISNCSKCCNCTIDDYPLNHEIPRELELAIKTTKIWRRMLYDAEEYCKNMGESYDSASSNESYDIFDVPSSSTSSITIV